ncbi:MAG TPA: glycosyltransferase family 4 protein [Actinomycetales bacterium]|jgi:glycosyltransferase involved in cell wall biosynthesis|nr:glycosyltransferase family 4 protein [Actinomycetales bacterium]
MRIGLVAPPWVPVPPVGYGGTEEVIDALARGLTDAGHEVVLFTVGESTCPVRRRWHYERSRAPMGQVDTELVHVLAAYEALADCDVIHDHTLSGPLVAARGPAGQWADQWGKRRTGPPVVATNHGTFTDESRRVFGAIAQHATVTAISEDQRSRSGQVPVRAVVHHGLDLQDYPVGPGSGDYLLFVGRMSEDKGPHRAVEIARRAGYPLVIAAKVRDAHEQEFFSTRIRPHLGRDVQFLGEVGGTERHRLMGAATALLNPISWPEPFGLTVIEAGACGTPVVSFDAGACRETVHHGTSGWLVQDVPSAVRAVQRIGEVRREGCRRWVEERFSSQRMVHQYLRVYEAALDGHAAAGQVPRPRFVGVTAKEASPS